jgi:hypothetical protein
MAGQVHKKFFWICSSRYFVLFSHSLLIRTERERERERERDRQREREIGV